MFNFGFGEIYDVIIEQYIGNTPIDQQPISAPEQFLIMQFMNLVQQVANQNQPMKIVMKRPIEIWNNFEQKQKIIWAEVEFKNWSDE